ncbi:MAG: peptidase M48 Ste24p [Gammaproteobacteria bacterium CG22_combo_CG10-13_8_21_14_all_40_8]|nr:MAG: peptidase M48 Ste24p [Gammaproteobacteria bacterium CG22_combo_CG10-13_8_21_14_all_40_8]
MFFLKKFRLLPCFFCLIFFGQATLAEPQNLPEIGDSASRYLSIIEEQQFGDKIIRQLRAQAPFFNDPLSVEYIKSIGFRLVAQNPNALDRQFDFFILKEGSINAFALPGGYIAMHTGLILKADTEDEIAGVLGHEIAHVTQRHLARRYERAQQLSIPTLLGVLVSVIAATQSPQAGMAGMAAITAGSQQILTNYTRSNEAEADRVGIITLEDAGFDPKGMTGFFEKLVKEFRNYPKPPEFLLTHPISERRLAEARDKILSLKPVTPGPQSSFKIFKERIRALSADESSVLEDNWYQSRIDEVTGDQKAAYQHGYALWLSNHQQSNKALQIAYALYQANPKSIEQSLLLGETLNKTKQYDEAIIHLKKSLLETPLNYPLTLELAKTELNANNNQEALDLLLPLVYQHPDDAYLFEMLAKTQSKLGQMDEAHESQGQFLWAMGKLDSALQQFRIAINGRSTDPYFNTRVRARIGAIEQEILEIRGMQK